MTGFSFETIKRQDMPQAGLVALEQRDFVLRETPEAFDTLSTLIHSLQRMQCGGKQTIPPGETTRISGASHCRYVLDEAWASSGATLVLEGCTDFELVMSAEAGVRLRLETRAKFGILIRACQRFTIRGLSLDLGRNPLMIDHCSDFMVSECRFIRAEGYGVTLLNSHHAWLYACHFEDCLAAGVMVLGQSHDVLIEQCSVVGCRGDFNWDAGLHLCATTQAVALEQIPEHCHEPVPLQQKQRRPFHIAVRDCVFTGCRAQGVYLEGAVNCLLQNNAIIANNKEGLCLDWGSSANLVVDNLIVSNGRRAAMTPASIEIDHLQRYPVLDDGSCSLKLPGISLDNAYLNRLTGNTVRDNFGGGIKLVRASQGNQICDNRILHNAHGVNRHTPHANGISLLSLGALKEFATSSGDEALLDFLPSSHNLIVGNVICGHSADVFQDAGCVSNRVQGIDLP